MSNPILDHLSKDDIERIAKDSFGVKPEILNCQKDFDRLMKECGCPMGCDPCHGTCRLCSHLPMPEWAEKEVKANPEAYGAWHLIDY